MLIHHFTKHWNGHGIAAYTVKLSTTSPFLLGQIPHCLVEILLEVLIWLPRNSGKDTWQVSWREKVPLLFLPSPPLPFFQKQPQTDLFQIHWANISYLESSRKLPGKPGYFCPFREPKPLSLGTLFLTILLSGEFLLVSHCLMWWWALQLATLGGK